MIEGPPWDLSAEYSSASATELEGDLTRLDELLSQVQQLNPELEAALAGAAELAVAQASALVARAQQIFRLVEQARPLLSNPLTYASCRLSVDSADEAAQQLQGRLQSFQVRFAELLEPLSQFVDRVPEPVLALYLADSEVAAAEFLLRHKRALRDQQLALAEENLINSLSQDGIHAWGRLYDQLAGTLSCEVLVDNAVQSMGIAQASGLLQSDDDHQRRAAWTAINAAWEAEQETCAAGLNAMVGWRLGVNHKRSMQAGREVHFLEAPVHMNRIGRATLDTLLAVAAEAIPLARRAALLQARGYAKAAFSPWDLRAPAPALPQAGTAVVEGDGSQRARPFAEAIELVAQAYAGVDPEMGEFIRMMAKRNWIEGTVGGRKRPGAYCTSFAKSRTPRVYMTYTGGDSDVITLAHELGHAFHAWVMRDLPDSQRSCGMALAETASTFGETVVRDALAVQASDSNERYRIAWEDISSLPSFVLNIPTRFEFEKNFYQLRQQRPLRPEEIKALMSKAWQKWYGDVLSEPDPMFWASKLHFFISGLSFYNFPYLFGYLFSMGIYARRAAAGADFYPRYRALLRDSGRMSAEDLAMKHLSVDLTEPDYWRDTLAMIETRVDDFGRLTEQIFPA